MSISRPSKVGTALLLFGVTLFPGFNNSQSRQSEAAAGTQIPHKGVQLTIRVEKEFIDPDEPDVLTLSVKNGSKSVVNLVETYPERDYEFEVKDQTGQRVPLTENGKKLVTNSAIYRCGPLKIRHGKEVYHRLVVNQLYDMRAPGEYFISASRKIFGPDFKHLTTVISTPVKVIVR